MEKHLVMCGLFKNKIEEDPGSTTKQTSGSGDMSKAINVYTGVQKPKTRRFRGPRTLEM